MAGRGATALRSRAALGGAVLAWLGGSARDARASNEDDYFPGSRASLVAGAVVATVDDASAPYFNPAGLGAARSDRLDVSASAYTLRRYAAPAFVRLGPATEDAAVTELVTVPIQIAYVRRLSSSTALGLGYYVPRATDATLRTDLEVDRAGGTAEAALATRESASKFLLAAALGTQVTPELRLGGGLFGGYERALDSILASGSSRTADGVVRRFQHLSGLVESSRMSLQPMVGIQADVGRFSFGASAAGPRLQLTHAFDARTVLSSGGAPPGGPAEAFHTSDTSADGGPGVALREWGRYRLGVAYRAARLTLATEIDVAPALARPARGVDTRRAVWNARVGCLYTLSDRALFGWGVFTDRSAAPRRQALQVLGLTAGLELTEIFKLSDAGGRERLRLGSTFALRYSRGSGPTDTLAVGDDGSFAGLAGPTTQTVDEVSLVVGSSLRF